MNKKKNKTRHKTMEATTKAVNNPKEEQEKKTSKPLAINTSSNYHK